MRDDGSRRFLSFDLFLSSNRKTRESTQLAERESDLEENETKSLLSFDYLFFFIFFFKESFFDAKKKKKFMRKKKKFFFFFFYLLKTKKK